MTPQQQRDMDDLCRDKESLERQLAGHLGMKWTPPPHTEPRKAPKP